MQGRLLEELVREPLLAQHAAGKYSTASNVVKSTIVMQGRLLEELVREPPLAHYALLESIRPLQMWLRALPVLLVDIQQPLVLSILAHALGVAGRYSTTTAVYPSTCLACSAGRYSTTVGATSSSTCKPCARGTFQNQVAQTSCVNCAAGQYNGEKTLIACKF